MRTNEAVASHLGWDVNEMADRRYQPTRFKQAIYVVGDGYMTACPPDRKRPSQEVDEEHPWQQVPSWVTDRHGWTIWHVDPTST